jgi:hypothetical protein
MVTSQIVDLLLRVPCPNDSFRRGFPYEPPILPLLLERVGVRYIAAFQLVGYSVWIGEAAGSSPACYTKMRCSVMATHRSHKAEDPGSNPGVATRIMWLSSMVEFYADTVKDDGSNPSVTTVTGL